MNARRRPGGAFLAQGTLLLAAFVAVFASFVASDLPIACRANGVLYVFPNVTRPPALIAVRAARRSAGDSAQDWEFGPWIHFGADSADAPPVAPPLSVAGHPLGTDEFGRDVTARLVYGARTSLGTGLLAALTFVGVGTLLGGLAGFYGGIIEALVARSIETLTPFPTLILVLVVQSLVARPTAGTMLLAIGLTRWTEVARVVRAEVLLVASQDYALAARALGVRPLRVLLRHVAPNAATPVVVAAAFGLAQVLLVEASLEFLRVDVGSDVSWGEMLSEARDRPDAYWLLLLPGVTLFVVVAALNRVGELLHDALDPRRAQVNEPEAPAARARSMVD